MTTVAVAPVGPRAVGEAFLYRGTQYTPRPCVVVERFDHLEKCMIDTTVVFPDETMTWAFDFQLHTLDCPGPEQTGRGVLNRAPCACGAWPGDPNHKFRVLGRIKKALETKAEIEHGSMVVRVTDDGAVERVTRNTRTR